MANKQSSDVSTSPSLKKQKFSVQKNPLRQRMIRNKTPEPKFLLGLKRFLIQKNQKGVIQKRMPEGARTVNNTNKSRLSVSTDVKRKHKAPAKNSPVLPIQVSSDGNENISPVKSPLVLPIQTSNYHVRRPISPAKSPPVLSIQASSDCIRKSKSPAKSPPVLAIQNQNSQVLEQEDHDLHANTSPVAAFPSPVPQRENIILRESNAVCPATIMPTPLQPAHHRVGFDRNLEPREIFKMAELRGKDYFIMKWKGSDIMDLVPAEVAKTRCPQVVIQFYERHLCNVHNSAMDRDD